MIRLAKGLDLPADAVTQKLAFLGTSGGGKTYGASKLAELMLAAGAQVVVLDPVGVWYGLRLGPGGRGPGRDVPVLGGIHGDIPLEAGAGALVADTIVDAGTSAVLDVSMLRKAQRKEFATAFAEQLFHRKKSTRSALHLFIEEAQTFLPQFTGAEERRMLGAFEDLTKVGRNFGIGHTLISQRPQAVNKDALNQVGTLFVFRTIAKQERRAIEDWIVEHGVEAAVESLPKLETGEAFVWSPSWLREFKKIRIERKETFDASATPAAGHVAREVKLGKLDLAKLEQAMKSVVERAKADDPRALRARIAQLERELAGKRSAPKTVEIPVVNEKAIGELRVLSGKLANAIEELRIVSRPARAEWGAARGDWREPPRPIPPAPPRPRGNGSAPPDASLGRPERAVLSVLSQFPEGCVIVKIAMIARYAHTSGAFRNTLSKLRTAGLIEGENSGTMRITPAGAAAVGTVDPLPAGRDLTRYWLSHPALGKPERAIVETLAGDSGKTLEEIAEATGYKPTSGAFRNTLSRLRTLGILQGGNRERMRLHEELA